MTWYLLAMGLAEICLHKYVFVCESNNLLAADTVELVAAEVRMAVVVPVCLGRGQRAFWRGDKQDYSAPAGGERRTHPV